MGYILFLLVNATLFLRPAELVPELAAYRIYETLILSCLAVSLPQILQYFLTRPLSGQPVTVCVFGLLLAVVLSHLANGNLELALENAYEFAKVIVYFVLLVAVVNNASRFRQFMFWIMIFSTLLTAVAVLRYYEVVDIKTPAMQKFGPDGLPLARKGNDGGFAVDKEYDPRTGEETTVQRLVGTGIFNDPNEMSTVLALGFLLGLYFLLDGASGPLRLAGLGPLILFLFALGLTQSRGGFLCLLAGSIAILCARFGWRQMLWLLVLSLPPILLLFAGRMTTISATEGTGQSRVQIWREGLQMIKESPFFGVGMDQYILYAYMVAHNSFISCYAELGLFGGTIFLGLFYFAFLTLVRLGRLEGGFALPEELRQLQPFLLGILVAYTVAIMSLSRSFVVPTYLVLGLVAAYANVCASPVQAPVVRLELKLGQRLAFVSVLFLVGVYLFVRVFVRA